MRLKTEEMHIDRKRPRHTLRGILWLSLIFLFCTMASAEDLVWKPGQVASSQRLDINSYPNDPLYKAIVRERERERERERILDAGVELIRNGDFSSDFNGWQREGIKMGSKSRFTPNISIVNNRSMSQAVKLAGISGRNYNLYLIQDVNLSSSFRYFKVSFDWKVTKKESRYGAAYIKIHFLDKYDTVLGYITYWDTAHDAHSVSYWRGKLDIDRFIGVRKYKKIFDWESVSVNTSEMSGMDPRNVAKIRVTSGIQNNAGQGGTMLVDNFSILGK